MVYTGAPKSLCSSTVFETLLFKILKFNCMCVYTFMWQYIHWIYVYIYMNKTSYFFSQDVQKHYVSYEKPYRGEMGIQTYLPHQMKGYFMVGKTKWSIGVFLFIFDIMNILWNMFCYLPCSFYLFASHFPTFMLGP